MLYPIIRRQRRPLLPPEERPRHAAPVVPETPKGETPNGPEPECGPKIDKVDALEKGRGDILDREKREPEVTSAWMVERSMPSEPVVEDAAKAKRVRNAQPKTQS